jgi:hypothetical protein
MLDYIVTDIELKNAVLREWREPRPAFVLAASPIREFGELHHFHFATSASSFSGVAADVAVISGCWAGTMPFFVDGAVLSKAMASGLKPDSVWEFAQNFESTGGIPHKQHKARNVQLPRKRPPFMHG